ncbi:hypothetical protein DFR59_10529 [Falsibacillus pallidus]|uniref:Uncharacterized protein n=2 Tax=Falsibacillus pallidus TaxID=493781 RepID=A0A370GFV1_9BACI|nr:hypothetical protein DFR59_10529 [Falsibacillus pallidus]
MGSKKKKSKNKRKQYWGLSKEERMEIARPWIKELDGENTVIAYSKKFGLNLKNSMKDLRSIGYKISSQEKVEVDKILDDKRQRKLSKKRKKEEQEERRLAELYDFDETFAFIAGYTEGGAPFGVTYEEMDEMDEEMDEIEDNDLPF